MAKGGAAAVAAQQERLQHKCFREYRIAERMPLPPRGLEDVAVATNRYLNRMLFQYNEQLEGIVVAIDNVCLMSHTADLYNASPFVIVPLHYRVIVFAPVAGTRMRGIVNKISPDHIGLLLYGVFNASVPTETLGAGWEYDMFAKARVDGDGGLVDDDDDGEDVQTWEGEWWQHGASGTVVKIGDTVTLDVTNTIVGRDTTTVIGSFNCLEESGAYTFPAVVEEVVAAEAEAEGDGGAPGHVTFDDEVDGDGDGDGDTGAVAGAGAGDDDAVGGASDASVLAKRKRDADSTASPVTAADNDSVDDAMARKAAKKAAKKKKRKKKDREPAAE